jgi:hypothetical protein
MQPSANHSRHGNHQQRQALARGMRKPLADNAAARSNPASTHKLTFWSLTELSRPRSRGFAICGDGATLFAP